MSQKVRIEEEKLPSLEQLLLLYQDVSWTAYTDDPETLYKAIQNSLKLWTLWEGEDLIGLARVVGDGVSIIYIQDILILEKYQGRGLGSELLQRILKEYQEVRQIVLLTDKTEKTIAFYKKNGLTEASDYHSVAFMK